MVKKIDKVVLAIDVMGGDKAPDAPLVACNKFLKKNKNVFFLLVGDAVKIKPYLKKYKLLRKMADIIHTKDVIKNEERVSVALRIGKKSSMAMAIAETAMDRADAVISAGNTGALMGFSMFAFKRIKGIDRPAICGSFPTLRGMTCALDLGANLKNSAEELCQFALMGSEFAKIHFLIKNPKVGLLNVGSENTKGFDYLQKASAMLQRKVAPFDRMHYYGFIEGDDIAKGTVDVCVTDGFAGNVFLKTAEGIGWLINSKLKETFSADMRTRVSYLLAHHELKKIRNFLDPRYYNGAPFLGLNKIAIKGHGSSDQVAFRSAIQLAYELVSKHIVNNVRKNIERINHHSIKKARIA
ncbi:MAG: phosphate acyltransferase PlsX [Alphaproteobacteria bacterium]